MMMIMLVIYSHNTANNTNISYYFILRGAVHLFYENEMKRRT